MEKEVNQVGTNAVINGQIKLKTTQTQDLLAATHMIRITAPQPDSASRSSAPRRIWDTVSKSSSGPCRDNRGT